MTNHPGKVVTWIAVVVSAQLIGLVRADTLHVPGEHTTIQAAIDAAEDGDTVEIADGTYTGEGNKNLDFAGKAITVRSASGNPALCIIDCEGEGRGFYFHNGEGTDSIVEGLTITNGYANADSPDAQHGGGICCDNSSPTFTSCVIRGNSAYGTYHGGAGGGVFCHGGNPSFTNCTINGNATLSGGGLYCYEDSFPVLTNCTISDNTARSGGGIYCYWDSIPALISCTISENTAENFGGGLYCRYYGNPSLNNCTISGNSAISCGGGVYCYTSSPALNDCTIRNNSASGDESNGGGLYCINDSNPTLSNCTVTENATDSSGGGVFSTGCSPVLSNCRVSNNSSLYGGGTGYNGGNPTLINCIISGNIAYKNGGGIHCINNNSLTTTNCTIIGNTAHGEGGGVYCNSSNPTLTNSILWGDVPEEVYIYSGNPEVAYCNVQGGWTGEGNIAVDPQLAFATDFHLMSDSPCIDAGTNVPPGELPDDDYDGNPRPLDGDGDADAITDIGAFEFAPTAPAIALVPEEFEFFAPEGGGNPPTQTLSMRNCGAGVLNWEITGQPAWLMVTPSSGESSGEVDEITLSVDISTLSYGSYNAILDVLDAQAGNSPRQVLVNIHISTMLYVPDEYGTIQAAIDSATVPGDVVEIADGTYVGTGNKDLDFCGRTITVRSASGNPELCLIDCENEGRGFYFHSGEGPDSIVKGLTIMNGYVDNNSPGAGDGGGVHCDSYSSPTLADCSIVMNTAQFDGGGIHCNFRSSPTIINCTINGNASNGNTGRGGGGVYCWGSSCPTLTNCTISDNSAYHGGGIHCYSRCRSTLSNCTISGNCARGDGGGVYCCSNSHLKLDNCTIVGNSSVDTGGGICCEYSCKPAINNCAIRDNSSEAWGGGIYFDTSYSPTLVNCTISGNSANSGGGVMCSDGSPTLSNCSISGNVAFIEGGGVLSRSSSSPTIYSCTISGNIAYWNGGGVYYYQCSPMLTNCTISCNWAENRGGGVYCSSNSSPTLTNCILWGDTPQEIYVGSSSPVVTYSNIQDGTGESWFGEGCIDVDPLFVDPDGPDDDPNTLEDNDYRLASGSPSIDAGDNTAVLFDITDLDGDGDIDERTPFDLDYKPRFVQDPYTEDTGLADLPLYRYIVDMGAYEYQYCFGDLNGDDSIDIADLAELLGHYGIQEAATYEDGDLDGDCDVDIADLAELLGVFGTICE